MKREDVESALLAAEASRRGVRVQASTPVLDHLTKAGHITAHGNLTEKGARERGRLMTQRLDQAFG